MGSEAEEYSGDQPDTTDESTVDEIITISDWKDWTHMQEAGRKDVLRRGPLGFSGLV